MPPGHNITVESSTTATVKCVSHYGNPPATLKWFLGNKLVPASSSLISALRKYQRLYLLTFIYILFKHFQFIEWETLN